MEAKGTVMNSQQVDEVEEPFRYEDLGTHAVVDAYLEAQAEISFKFGQEAERERIKTLLYKLGYTRVAEDMDIWGIDNRR